MKIYYRIRLKDNSVVLASGTIDMASSSASYLSRIHFYAGRPTSGSTTTLYFDNFYYSPLVSHWVKLSIPKDTEIVDH
jgi:hypothetical protein